MGWQPVEYKVLVLPKEVEAKTAGGIYLPDTSKEKEENQVDEGVIVNVGPNSFEEWNHPFPKPGDRVIFAKYAGKIQEIDGVKHRIINDKEILMVYLEE